MFFGQPPEDPDQHQTAFSEKYGFRPQDDWGLCLSSGKAKISLIRQILSNKNGLKFYKRIDTKI
jgi:hypothetical protein